jgi:antitoxin component YwqK of YwqJK toxin-antitoxin module
MSGAPEQPQPRTDYHRDGSVRARGQTLRGVPVGYWEWFRKDGSKLRSGHFDEAGQPVGEWITYDARGRVYKVSRIKPKPASGGAGERTESRRRQRG